MRRDSTQQSTRRRSGQDSGQARHRGPVWRKCGRSLRCVHQVHPNGALQPGGGPSSCRFLTRFLNFCLLFVETAPAYILSSLGRNQPSSEDNRRERIKVSRHLMATPLFRHSAKGRRYGPSERPTASEVARNSSARKRRSFSGFLRTSSMLARYGSALPGDTSRCPRFSSQLDLCHAASRIMSKRLSGDCTIRPNRVSPPAQRASGSMCSARRNSLITVRTR